MENKDHAFRTQCGQWRPVDPDRNAKAEPEHHEQPEQTASPAQDPYPQNTAYDEYLEAGNDL